MNLRLADARPWSIGLNLAVANQLLREGNVDGARRYGARAESALVPGSSAANPDQAASVRLFPAYVAWLQDDPEEMLRLLNHAAASVKGLAGDERRQVLRRLWTMYAAAGRLRQAEQMIEAARAHDPGDFVYALNTDLARAELFVERGDLSGLRAFAATRWNDPLPDPAPPFVARRLTFLIDAGLLDAAERDLEWFKRRTAQASGFAPGMLTTQFQPFYASSVSALEFARGRPDVAVALLEQALPVIRKGPPVVLSAGGSQGQYAAVKLAAALEAVGNLTEAISTLEQAVEDRVGVTIGNSPNRWLRTRAQLARLYRKNGHDDKARTVESHLLKLLAAAESDHPLVVELRGRR
jgi:ATP/maltotriose-dependent transcriptional regulator MalT